MDDQTKKAFDFASDVTKQLITLSTGIIALTMTFLKDYAASASEPLKKCLALGWGFFLLSVFFGLWTMLALTGSLGPKHGAAVNLDTKLSALSIRGRNITYPSFMQILMFLVALGLTIWFGVFAVIYGNVQNVKTTSHERLSDHALDSSAAVCFSHAGGLADEALNRRLK